MIDKFGSKTHKRISIWIPILFFGFAFLVIALYIKPSPLHLGQHILGSQFELAAAGLGAWLFVVIVWWSQGRGKFDPFELPVWFSLNAYIQVVLNVWLLQRDLKLRSPWLVGNSNNNAVQAVVLIGVGLTFLWAGYVWVTRWLEQHPGFTQPRAEVPRLPVIFGTWAVAWLFSISAVIAGVGVYLSAGRSVWTNYLAFITVLGDLATFVILLYHFKAPTRIGWVWLVFVCSSNIILGLVIGTKSAVFILLYVAMAIFYTHRKLSKFWLALGILTILLVVPVVNTFRANLFESGFDRSLGATFSERVPILLESARQVTNQPISNLVEDTGATFESRQGSILEITAAFMAVHPRIKSFVGVEMLSELVTNVIPRVIWPGKPAGHPELYLIYTNYLGASWEYSLATPGQFGDAYRTGGWAFVVLWFGLLGAIAAWLYQQGPGRRNLGGTAFYLIILTSMITYDSHIFRLTTDLLKYGILLWIFTRFVLFKPVNIDVSNAVEEIHNK